MVMKIVVIIMKKKWRSSNERNEVTGNNIKMIRNNEIMIVMKMSVKPK